MTLDEAIEHLEKRAMRADSFNGEVPVVSLSIIKDTLKQLKGGK